MAMTDATVPTSSARELASVSAGLKKSRTNLQMATSRFLRQKLAVFGTLIVITLCLVALLAPWISPTPYDQASLRNANLFPSWDFPFGTDPIGYNVLSRVIF